MMTELPDSPLHLQTTLADATPTPRNYSKDRLLRIRSVGARTGLSVATIYRRELVGSFPKRKQIGLRSVAWYESDIDEFIANPLTYRSRSD